MGETLESVFEVVVGESGVCGVGEVGARLVDYSPTPFSIHSNSRTYFLSLCWVSLLFLFSIPLLSTPFLFSILLLAFRPGGILGVPQGP